MLTNITLFNRKEDQLYFETKNALSSNWCAIEYRMIRSQFLVHGTKRLSLNYYH